MCEWSPSSTTGLIAYLNLILDNESGFLLLPYRFIAYCLINTLNKYKNTRSQYLTKNGLKAYDLWEKMQ